MGPIRKALLIGMLVTGLCLAATAQTSLEEELKATSQDLAKCYQAKDWAGALGVIARQLALAERAEDPMIRAGILYNKACVLALAGRKEASLAAAREAVAAGITQYDAFVRDPDFDSLRGDPEFKAFLADLKARYGPKPLAWDTTRDAPPFEFVFDGPETSEFAEMRREFAIDDVVAGAKDDYERLRRLTAWVSSRWEHSPNQMASKSDPLTILREAKAGGRFICREYALALAGVAKAYGMPARLLNLLPRDVEVRSEAHSVVEVWLESLGKWVLADGQFGIIGELDGGPLNGLELQAAFAADNPVRCVPDAAACPEWKPFILRNAFYFKLADNQRSYRGRFTRQIVLVPAGAAEPHKFAGGNEGIFEGAVYTSNPASFYAPPNPRILKFRD